MLRSFVGNIIQNLSSAIDSFITYIQRLNSSQLQLSRTRTWGPKEVLIHIVFWHEQYCKILRALSLGEKPAMLTGSFIQLNALAIEQNKHETTENLLSRLNIAEKELEGLYKKFNAKELKIAFKDGGKLRTLEEAIVRVTQHINSHHRQLLKVARFRIK